MSGLPSLYGGLGVLNRFPTNQTYQSNSSQNAQNNAQNNAFLQSGFNQSAAQQLMNIAPQQRKPLSPDRREFVDRIKRMMAILEEQDAAAEKGEKA